MPPARALASCCCKQGLSVLHLQLCPSPSWMSIFRAVPWDSAAQCPHSASCYGCLRLRSIVWGNPFTYFVFQMSSTFNKNGICVLISQFLSEFGLFPGKEGEITTLTPSLDRKFSYWKDHAGCSIEKRLEAERWEFGRHMRSCSCIEELVLGRQRSESKTGIGGNVDNSYWLIRCFSGVGAWIRRKWNISGSAAGSC